MPARKIKAKKAPPAPTRSAKAASDIVVGADLDLGKSEPCFTFGLLDSDHHGSWDWDLTEGERATFLGFMRESGRLTWNELRSQTTGGHKKHHDQATESLCKEARDRLGEIGLGDQESLFRFRLAGKTRLWGVFIGERHEFNVLWWDRDHEVYPT